MRGSMMDTPLMISSILEHARRFHGDSEIVSRTVEGPIHRYTYRDAAARTTQLAHAVRALGVQAGDRVATIAWNGYRHFELYYGISCIGAVVHTIKPALTSDADRVHRQPRRRRFRLRRPNLRPAGRSAGAVPPARARLRRDDRRGAHAANDALERALLRESARGAADGDRMAAATRTSAERRAPARVASVTQVGLADAIVRDELGAGAGERDAAGLEDVRVLRGGEGEGRVLLRDQDAHAVLRVDRA